MAITLQNAIDGCWTFYNDPRTIVIGGNAYIGSVARGGGPIVSRLGTTVAHRASLLSGPLESSGVDDHDNPTFLRRASDNRILAFYCGHNESEIYLRISTNADDMTAWGSETNLDASLGGVSYTYTNPIQLTGETNSPIYLFTRMDDGVVDRSLYRSTSTDNGATWGAATRLLTGNRPYFRMVQNGTTRIDFCCNDGHPNTEANNSVYHFYYDNGTWRDSSAADIGAPPFTPSTDLTEVYDGSGVGGNSWVWDIKIASDGEPVIGYAAFPTTADHRYRRARLSTGTWTDVDVVAGGGALYAGEPYYSGGIWIDPDDVDTVYCSREITGVFQITRQVTANDGTSWTETQLTSGSEDCFRPAIIDGANEPRLAYCAGTYTSFTDYQTRIELLDSTATP